MIRYIPCIMNSTHHCYIRPAQTQDAAGSGQRPGAVMEAVDEASARRRVRSSRGRTFVVCLYVASRDRSTLSDSAAPGTWRASWTSRSSSTSGLCSSYCFMVSRRLGVRVPLNTGSHVTSCRCLHRPVRRHGLGAANAKAGDGRAFQEPRDRHMFLVYLRDHHHREPRFLSSTSKLMPTAPRTSTVRVHYT
jgi:hypothetical protein